MSAPVDEFDSAFSLAFPSAFDPTLEPQPGPNAGDGTGCVPFTPDYACCDEWETLDAELAERATALAWSTLRVLSGGQIGNCPVLVRPCLTPPCNVCNAWSCGDWMSVGIRAGEWVNCPCGKPECSCERMCEIVLPGMVAAIIDVTLDGVSLPLEHFRIDNGHRLVRTDGECWPACQNMNAAVCDPGTLGITYLPGILPDAAALWAAGVLACEYAKACTGGKCRLPSSVTSIARQGVSMVMGTGMFPDGLTGIREVDAWLIAVNPTNLVVPPTVWSPDVPWVKHRYETPLAKVVP